MCDKLRYKTETEYRGQLRYLDLVADVADVLLDLGADLWKPLQEAGPGLLGPLHLLYGMFSILCPIVMLNTV